MTVQTRSEFRERLLSWLRQNVPDRADSLYYHLGDLRAEVVRIIDELPNMDPENQAAKVRHAAAALTGQLFDHIPNHTKEVRRDLLAWRKDLFSAAEARGEL
jgi:hypothetical protein